MSAQALNPKHQPARLPAARNWACSYPATADTSPRYVHAYLPTDHVSTHAAPTSSSRGLAAAAANQARHTGTGTAIGATQSHSALRPGATTADLPRLRRRRACDRAVLATTLAEPLQPSPELSQRARAASSWHDAALGGRASCTCLPPNSLRPPSKSLACVPKGREDPDDGGRQCRLSAYILTHPAQALWNGRDSDLTKSYILADIRRADAVGSPIISSPYSCQSMVPIASLRPGFVVLRQAWRCTYWIASNE
ncbi:hypothetical protein COCVIDRAFT_35594 [Bipolaris victoriae FI3]|uniref:Uncharacterized protein n=1 Tax=Bipolaris victoriae (strain FI3) TaxID=930091 RepID=W7ETR6_BIPV3|nr:hypothetical protein COCVIDRAFT_35594 [Bipolaris victoriae FI3]